MYFFQTCNGKVTSQKAAPLAAFLAIFISIAANGQHELVVEVSNIKNQEGNVAVALYNTENGFMKSPFQGKSLKAAKGSVEFVFQDIPAGTYAVSVMHDANENGKLDYRTSGIPKEGFGFSNNALSKLGIPKFEKAKFEFTTKTKIQIALRYIEPHRKKESEP